MSSLGAPHEFLPQAPKIFHSPLSVNVIFRSLVSLDTYQKNKKLFSFCYNLGNNHSKKGTAAASPAIPTAGLQPGRFKFDALVSQKEEYRYFQISCLTATQ